MVPMKILRADFKVISKAQSYQNRFLWTRCSCIGVPRLWENAPPLGPYMYSRHMPRVPHISWTLWWSYGGGRFLMSEAPLYIMNGRAHYEMGARERVPHLRATFIKHSRMVSAPAALPPDPSPDILRFCGSLQGENQRHRAMGGMSAGRDPGRGIGTHGLKLDAL